MEPGPSGLVTAQAEYSLHPQSTDAMLLVRHIPHRLKPKPQRLARTLEDRPRGRRCLTLASHTSQLAPSRHPRQASPAGRTAETIRPTNTPKKIHAGCLRREPLIEFLERAGIVDPANGMGCILDHPNILSLRERIGYPIFLGSIRELYALVIECLERQEVGLWTARVSRCGFRRRAG